MAEEDNTQETIELEGDQAGPKSKKKLIIIAIVVLILVGVSVVGTLYFLGSEDEAEAEDAEGQNNDTLVEGESAKAQGDSMDDAMSNGVNSETKALYYPLKPPYIVNIIIDAP